MAGSKARHPRRRKAARGGSPGRVEIFEASITIRANPHIAERLSVLAQRDRVAHAYIFVGPPEIGTREAAIRFARDRICPQRGCGSCSDCRQLARGAHPHLLDVRPAEGRVTLTIEQIHQLHHDLILRPERSLPRMALIDPADALSEPAMNALLKILEEPPDGVTLVLLAENLSGLLPTVHSRCHILRFYPASEEEIRLHLRETAGLAPADVDLIAALSEGSAGTADRLARDIDSIRTFVRSLLEAVRQSEISLIVESLLKSKEPSETRNRARLAFQVLAIAHRDALRGRPGPLGPVAGTPDRWLRAIDALLEHEILVGQNANVGLTVADALLQVAP